MALTLFHCALVWPLFIYKPSRFDFIGLSVGAVLPDFLEPVMVFIPAYYGEVRAITHSLIGAVTLIFLLALVLSLFVVPRIIRFLKNRYSDVRFYKFAGIDVLKQRGKLNVITYSVLLGTTSHVILDVFYHRINPLFYPFGNVALPFVDSFTWKIITQGIIFLVFMYIAYKYWWKLETRTGQV